MLALACRGAAEDDAILEVRPPGSPRLTQISSRGPQFTARHVGLTRIESIEDYLDPATRAEMVRGVLGRLSGDGGHLAGFAAGSFAELLSERSPDDWTVTARESEALARALIDRVNATFRGSAGLVVDEAGGVDVVATVTTTDATIDETDIAALLGSIIALETLYANQARMALVTGFADALAATRRDA